MRDLDESLRRHLGRLARDEASLLGPVERGRILARVREASSEPHRASWLWLAAAVGVLAVAWASRMLGGLEGEPGGEPARVQSGPPAPAAEPDPRPAPAEDPDRAERAEPAELACARLPVPRARDRRGGGLRAIELGGRARFVVFGGAEARLERVSRCATTLVLDDGRVAVHAIDLAGGELVVRTPAGEVVVHGTVFDVQFSAGDARLSVAVAEGEVGVVAGGEQVSRLSGGHALDLTEGRALLSEIDDERAEGLLETVRQPIRPRPPSRPRAPPEPDRPPPRGEVVGGVPFVHQPGWSTRDD